MKKFNTSEGIRRGWTYQINDVLQGNERPCFYTLDNGMKGHRVYLEEA